MSRSKLIDWVDFSDTVNDHVLDYVIPQYGENGNDPCTEYSAADMIRQINKYTARQGKNSRPGQDLLDLVKIAHYAQMAHTLISEDEKKC